MGEQLSGNARAINYRHPPIVRMTNTAIEAGTTSFEEMIRGIKLGIYACDCLRRADRAGDFSFSSGYAYMSRDGQIAEMVKDVILAGNLFTTLLNIDAHRATTFNGFITAAAAARAANTPCGGLWCAARADPRRRHRREVEEGKWTFSNSYRPRPSRSRS